METTKNKLSQQESIFFEKLRNYLDTPLYFYGSIQRDDYVPQYSDIDVNIFSNNEKDIIIKLQNFLNVDRNNFKKTLLKMKNTNIIIPGYKLKYNDEINKINAEFAIFNEKNKNLIIELHKSKFSVSYFVCLIILFIKFLYYELKIIPSKIFRKLKYYFIGLTEEDNNNFIILNMD
jgi:hypothetical protein